MHSKAIQCPRTLLTDRTDFEPSRNGYKFNGLHCYQIHQINIIVRIHIWILITIPACSRLYNVYTGVVLYLSWVLCGDNE